MSPARKPFIFRIQGLLAAALGFDRLRRIFAILDALLFRSPFYRSALASNYIRIRAFADPRGKPPPRSDVGRHLGRLARHFAENQATIAALALSLDHPVLRRAELDLLQEIERLRGLGRGVILGSAHFGNLWLASQALARVPIPLTCVILNGFPYRWLETPHFKVLGLEEAARPCIKALRKNECVLVFGDMDLYWRGPLHDFFGSPFPPPRALVRLSILSGAPILPVYAVSRGERVHFECGSAIDPKGKSPEDMGALFFRSLERWIGRYPEQWFLLKNAWNAKAVARSGRRQLRAAQSYNRFFGASP